MHRWRDMWCGERGENGPGDQCWHGGAVLYCAHVCVQIDIAPQQRAYVTRAPFKTHVSDTPRHARATVKGFDTHDATLSRDAKV